MKRIKVLLADDQERSIENLSTLIYQQCQELDIVDIFKNIEKFNILFFQLIFVTAFIFYIIDSIKFSVLYYILKPIKFNEFYRAFQKLKKTVNTTNYSNKINYSNFLMLKNIQYKLILNINSVIFIVMFMTYIIHNTTIHIASFI